jgi:hypothetical protein
MESAWRAQAIRDRYIVGVRTRYIPWDAAEDVGLKIIDIYV